jgi:hypothetical protein
MGCSTVGEGRLMHSSESFDIHLGDLYMTDVNKSMLDFSIMLETFITCYGGTISEYDFDDRDILLGRKCS